MRDASGSGLRYHAVLCSGGINMPTMCGLLCSQLCLLPNTTQLKLLYPCHPLTTLHTLDKVRETKVVHAHRKLLVSAVDQFLRAEHTCRVGEKICACMPAGVGLAKVETQGRPGMNLSLGMCRPRQRGKSEKNTSEQC